MRYFLILLASFSFINAPQAAQAHVLLTDGSIGAVLHIDPADDPIAGQPATFFYDFKDKEEKFDISRCECQVSITKDKVNLITDFLIPTQTGGSFNYTFPEKGVYTVILTGKPLDGRAFQSFALADTIRIERVSKQSNTVWQTIVGHFLHVGLIVIGFITFLVLDTRERLKTKRANQTKNTPTA